MAATGATPTPAAAVATPAATAASGSTDDPLAGLADEDIVAICKRNGKPTWTTVMVRKAGAPGKPYRSKILKWRRAEASAGAGGAGGNTVLDLSMILGNHGPIAKEMVDTEAAVAAAPPAGGNDVAAATPAAARTPQTDGLPGVQRCCSLASCARVNACGVSALCRFTSSPLRTPEPRQRLVFGGAANVPTALSADVRRGAGRDNEEDHRQLVLEARATAENLPVYGGWQAETTHGQDDEHAARATLPC